MGNDTDKKKVIKYLLIIKSYIINSIDATKIRRKSHEII